MREFELFMNLEDYEIVAFYPYTSCVVTRILSQNHNYKTEEHDFLGRFGNAVLEQAIAMGCHNDNKIVIELKYKHSDFILKHSNIFVGHYDNIWSIGLGVHQDEWLERNGSNRYFK